MRTLTQALIDAQAKPVTQPAFLVEIGFNTPVRISTFDTVSWNGYTWSAADVNVDSLRVAGLKASGTIILGNADNGYGLTLLSEGIVNKAIRVYGYDATATSASDVIQLVEALGGKGTIDDDGNHVRFSVRGREDYLFSPRTLVCPATGFTKVIAAGKVLNINGQSYRVTRG